MTASFFILLVFSLCKCDLSISAPPDRPPGDLWPSFSPQVFLRSWTIRTRLLRFWILLSLWTLIPREKKQTLCRPTLSSFSSLLLPGNSECQAIATLVAFYGCNLMFLFYCVLFCIYMYISTVILCFYLWAFLKNNFLHLFTQKWFTKKVFCLLNISSQFTSLHTIYLNCRHVWTNTDILEISVNVI